MKRGTRRSFLFRRGEAAKHLGRHLPLGVQASQPSHLTLSYSFSTMLHSPIKLDQLMGHPPATTSGSSSVSLMPSFFTNACRSSGGLARLGQLAQLGSNFHTVIFHGVSFLSGRGAKYIAVISLCAIFYRVRTLDVSRRSRFFVLFRSSPGSKRSQQNSRFSNRRRRL